MEQREAARYFVGTAITDPIASAIEKTALVVLTDPSWRIIPRVNWHVTALFIGMREPGQVERSIALISEVASAVSPIMLCNGRCLTMPKDDPSMMWIGFDPHSEMTDLHHALATALDVEPSPFVPYRPHITLARTRHAVRPLYEGPVIMEQLCLDTLTLFRSTPGPIGSVYTAVASWPMGRTDSTAPSEADGTTN